MIGTTSLSAYIYFAVQNIFLRTSFEWTKNDAVRTLEETERNQIFRTLSETRWRIEGKDGSVAILGLHPSTLRARMHKLGIVRPETKEPD